MFMDLCLSCSKAFGESGRHTRWREETRDDFEKRKTKNEKDFEGAAAQCGAAQLQEALSPVPKEVIFADDFKLVVQVNHRGQLIAFGEWSHKRSWKSTN